MKTLIILCSTLLVFLIIPSCDQNSHKPEIFDQVFYLDENSETGTIIGKIEADDLDEQQVLSFEIIKGNTENALSLERKTGILYVNNTSVLDYEKIQKIELQVMVSDNHHNDPLESVASISIIINNLNEYAPVINEQTFSVEEKCATGTAIGIIAATDADSGQFLSFRIEDSTGDQVLHVDSVSGELTVKDSTWFNYSINQEIVFMVSVCDNDSVNPIRSYALITVNVENVPYAILDIAGYVQKGPFISGSSITISELYPDLQPTGRVFSTHIEDNSGKFVLPDVELESQSVSLKAEGFYFNERTGKLSEAQLTLYNTVDITNQGSFNINVLSHLENDRIGFLMGNGLSFSEAKKQAKSEILAVFGFEGNEELTSEQLDISRAGNDNAILLAVSIILQGQSTTGDFSELISQFSNDIQADGTMDNASIGTDLINGVNHANHEVIRQNIEARYMELGIDAEIPDFEYYINQFIENTDFVPTNQLVYPASGSYGLNFLIPDKTSVAKNSEGSFAVYVPEGRSLKIDAIHEGTLWIAMNSGVNMVFSKYAINQQGYGHNIFETTSSGLCEIEVSFSCTQEHNTVQLNYFEDDETLPSYSKIIQISGYEIP